MSEKISECLKKQREYPRYLKNPNYRDGWIDASNYYYKEANKNNESLLDVILEQLELLE